MSDFRRRVARSRFARAAALPIRAKAVAQHDGRVLARSARWLVRSREHTNYTYDLTPLNREQMAWWVAEVTSADVAAIRGYMDELDEDVALREHVEGETVRGERRGLADPAGRYARRAGWYALTRALRPEHVVETGTDKGLGSCVFAAALLHNGTGRLTTIDINPDSGYLIHGRYAEVVDRIIGDSVATLEALDKPIDLFLHDSWHTFEHETNELVAAAGRLAPSAVVLSDNAHGSDAMMRWAERAGMRFLFFSEQPQDHWYPGAGIGAAWRAALGQPMTE